MGMSHLIVDLFLEGIVFLKHPASGFVHNGPQGQGPMLVLQ